MNQKELKLQAECTTWYNNTFLHHNKMCFAVNNNSHNALKGAFMKASGVRSGVSDLVIVLPDAKIIFCELKDIDGVQSKEQKEFQKQVESFGHTYLIIRSFTAFKQLFTDYAK